MRQMKSMCQLRRRNSPSVIHFNPTSSWRLTAWRIAVVFDATQFGRGDFALVQLVARLKQGFGRSKLPTWSARKGGFTRFENCLAAVAVLEDAVMCAPSLDLLDGQGKTAGQIARPSHTASVGGVKRQRTVRLRS